MRRETFRALLYVTGYPLLEAIMTGECGSVPVAAAIWVNSVVIFCEIPGLPSLQRD